MQIRIANSEDLDDLVRIYAAARRYMAEHGNPHQWGDGRPTPEEIANSVKEGACRVGVDEDDRAHFSFTIYSEEDPTYQRIYDGAWLNDEPYVTIHRVASDGTMKGVFSSVLTRAKDEANKLGIRNLRIDTHNDNLTMQHIVAKAGFSYCGIIHLEDGDPRLAYQLVL